MSSVKESAIRFNLIDSNGAKLQVIGKAGQSLTDACQMQGLDILLDDSIGGGSVNVIKHNDIWHEDVFGSDAQTNQSHVVLANEWYNKVAPPSEAEKELLNEIDEDEITATSRLGCKIILSKDCEGLTVYVPDQKPTLEDN